MFEALAAVDRVICPLLCMVGRYTLIRFGAKPMFFWLFHSEGVRFVRCHRFASFLVVLLSVPWVMMAARSAKRFLGPSAGVGVGGGGGGVICLMPSLQFTGPFCTLLCR